VEAARRGARDGVQGAARESDAVGAPAGEQPLEHAAGRGGAAQATRCRDSPAASGGEDASDWQEEEEGELELLLGGRFFEEGFTQWKSGVGGFGDRFGVGFGFGGFGCLVGLESSLLLSVVPSSLV